MNDTVAKNNGFKDGHHMMSAVMFWWEHLTFPQREFIVNNSKPFLHLTKLDNSQVYEIYFNNKDYFRELTGWPETEMRKV